MQFHNYWPLNTIIKSVSVAVAAETNKGLLENNRWVSRTY